MKPKINNQITAEEIRVIGQNGENLGVFKREEALALARPEEGLDLIEIVPNAKPPVAKLMNYDKWRYEEERKRKKEAFLQKSKSSSLKQIQISPRMAKNDLITRIKQLENFLNKNHIVEIQMQLKGREKLNKEWVNQKLNEFLNMISIEYKIISQPKQGGRGIVCQIEKNK
ncbi:MAG: translation initiation factor IF-3 [Patescibacteria group bacterium]|nr:translation initiation factor IF-3 [Patescibacteria group bacterium]MCX7589692.1 translation initiation factor IF-3 [Patescibacteria group bacterium]MDW8279697.1 translation initiation factor IF-3 [bacterium]